MAKTELGKRLNKAISAVEKFVTDLQKDAGQIVEALKELKEHEENKDEKEKGI